MNASLVSGPPRHTPACVGVTRRLRTTRDMQLDNALRTDLRSSACAAPELPSSAASPRSRSVGVPVLSWRRLNFALQGDGSYIDLRMEWLPTRGRRCPRGLVRMSGGGM